VALLILRSFQTRGVNEFAMIRTIARACEASRIVGVKGLFAKEARRLELEIKIVIMSSIERVMQRSTR